MKQAERGVAGAVGDRAARVLERAAAKSSACGFHVGMLLLCGSFFPLLMRNQESGIWGEILNFSMVVGRCLKKYPMILAKHPVTGN